MTGVASAGRFAASFLAYSRIFVGSSKIEVSGESLKNRQGELSEIFCRIEVYFERDYNSKFIYLFSGCWIDSVERENWNLLLNQITLLLN